MLMQRPLPQSGKANLAIEVGLLLVLSLIWGSSFTLIKVAVETLTPLTLVAARVTIAATVLVLIATMQGVRLPRQPRVWAVLMVQGLVQTALPFTLISWGEQYLASGLTGVLNATPPIFVLLIAMSGANGPRNRDRRKIAGVCLGLAGVVLTIGPGALGDMASAEPLAQAGVLAASLCYALGALWGRRLSSLPAIVSAAGAMSCAAAMLVPAAIVFDHPMALAPSRNAILAVLVLAFVCTALAMVIYFRLVRTLGALATTSGSYLRAGFSVILGVLFLNESFTWTTGTGMALIVSGVIAVVMPARGRLAQTPA